MLDLLAARMRNAPASDLGANTSWFFFFKQKTAYEMLNHALKGDFLKARDELRNLLVKYGLSGSDIIRQIHSEVFRLAIPEKTRISLIEAIGDTDFRLVQGGDEEVQLSALLAHLAAQSSVH